MEKARAISRATCGARPRNCMPSSAAASRSPARRRIASSRSCSTRSNNASPPWSLSTSPTSAPSTCTSSRSAECLAGNLMSSRFTKRGILQRIPRGLSPGHRVWNHELMHQPSPVERQRLGMLFVAGAAILFASKGLFSKALYQRGVGFELLVTVRALLAMPLFIWFARHHRTEADGQAPMRALVAASIAGIVGYYGGAMVDFWALELIDASIERVLLFSYPAMVILINSFMRRRAPERRLVLATL